MAAILKLFSLLGGLQNDTSMSMVSYETVTNTSDMLLTTKNTTNSEEDLQNLADASARKLHMKIFFGFILFALILISIILPGIRYFYISCNKYYKNRQHQRNRYAVKYRPGKQRDDGKVILTEVTTGKPITFTAQKSKVAKPKNPPFFINPLSTIVEDDETDPQILDQVSLSILKNLWGTELLH